MSYQSGIKITWDAETDLYIVRLSDDCCEAFTIGELEELKSEVDRELAEVAK